MIVSCGRITRSFQGGGLWGYLTIYRSNLDTKTTFFRKKKKSVLHTYISYMKTGK